MAESKGSADLIYVWLVSAQVFDGLPDLVNIHVPEIENLRCKICLLSNWIWLATARLCIMYDLTLNSMQDWVRLSL